MVTALLVKNYQIKLLKKVWCILSVLCTWFNSFSIQVEAHQVNKVLMYENNQKPEPLKRELRNQSRTHENQQLHRWSRSCVIFMTAPQPWIIHAVTRHIDDPE